MSGQDKIKPLVIGHYANPRCFRNNRPRCVDYVANSTAWMTGPIFETWLDNWNKKLSNEGRKILLYMDNFSGHTEMELSNIVIKFLPPNTTARTQPLDQGIIKNLKLFYRQQLLQNHVDALDVEQEYNPNLLDALRMLKKAWDKVKPSTIINCFRHAGFVVDNQTQAIEVAENDELNELEELWNRLKLSHDLEFYPNLQDYLSIDDLMDINENGSPQLEAETDVEMEVSDSDPSQLDAEYMTFESLLDDPGNVIPPSHDGGITFPEDYDYMPYEELLDMPQEVPRVVLKLKKAGNAWKANDPFYNEYEA
uniref:DDE-1 domain-containing protein n=1 Tax=Acrobeloides nanus TaxID=290746 RepID=A0A914D8A6_9BILA